MSDANMFSKSVVALLELSGLSKHDFAKRFGLSASDLSIFFKDGGNVKYEKMKDIASALGLPLSFFFSSLDSDAWRAVKAVFPLAVLINEAEKKKAIDKAQKAAESRIAKATQKAEAKFLKTTPKENAEIPGGYVCWSGILPLTKVCVVDSWAYQKPKKNRKK